MTTALITAAALTTVAAIIVVVLLAVIRHNGGDPDYPGVDEHGWYGLDDPACRGCGCTEDRACPGGCWWAADEEQLAAGLDPMTGNLCTACLPATDVRDTDREFRRLAAGWPQQITTDMPELPEPAFIRRYVVEAPDGLTEYVGAHQEATVDLRKVAPGWMPLIGAARLHAAVDLASVAQRARTEQAVQA